MIQTQTSPSPQKGPIEPRYALFAFFWALGTVFILIVIKGYAYWHSGSAAILATLTDSFTDAAMSLLMLMALKYSLRPADRSHRHGHGKMEGIGALFQAACLFGAALFLMFEGMQRFANPQAITHHMLGMGVAAIAIVLSILLVLVQRYCLTKAPSLAVESDQAHYTTDIALNGSVIAALAVAYYGGPLWVDPLCALAVAGYYIYAGRKIALKAADMLTDRELPQAVRERIAETIRRHPDILGFHDLRTRKSGMTIHITFDVEIDPDLPLRDAHELSRALEMDILIDYPHAEIIIHKDPYGDTHDARHQRMVAP
jgi:ferrous-iron efflux pump FieF